MISELSDSDPRSVGPYKLLGKIGTGGMGTVYLASSPDDDVVALKLIRPELADGKDFRRRFKSEVAAIRRVGGICTAKVRDADVDADRPWVVTDFVAGPNLADLVERRGPLPRDQQRVLALGLTEALVAVHRAGIVHRDLKPTNVLCSPSGPKVIDFGIAQTADATPVTLTGEVIGSPSWMSPEQVGGGAATSSADMFSLGSVLVFAATGRPPFGNGQLEGVMWRILNEPPDLGDDGSLDAELRPLVIRMLEKDSAKRPNAQELLGQLSGRGQDAARTVTQVLHRSWVLPAAEVIRVAASRNRQGPVEATVNPSDFPLSARVAGWYADPHGNGGLRWWDGVDWADEVADAPPADSVPLGPPGFDRTGERPNGRPASRHSFGKLFFAGIGLLVAISAAAVIWALDHNTGGSNPRRTNASLTTIAATVRPPAAASSLTSPSPTQAPRPNQAPASPSTPASATLAVSRELATQLIPPAVGYTGEPAGTYPNGLITTTVYDQQGGAGSAASIGFLGGFEATYSDTSGDFIDIQLLRFSSPQSAGFSEGPMSGLLPAESPKQSAFPAIPGAIAVNGTKQAYGMYHHGLAATKGPVLMLFVCSTPTGGPMPARLAAWAEQQYAHI
jgi:serine/threonine protein kinase